jgi:endonuclease/exonuclease/phosphatase family metal-dependent hydrolase
MVDRESLRCGAVLAPDGMVRTERVAWRVPKADDDRLAALCGGVGPMVIAPTPALPSDTPADTLLVVSWNTHVGVGNFGALVDTLTARHGGRLPPVAFLLQEVYRDEQRRGATRARKQDVRDLADAFGFSLFYVPSMQDEGAGNDRGNAILSNLPMSAFEAIELPLERQRRVAVAAAVHGRLHDGTCWQLRVVSAHLDRTMQTRALVEALGVAPATVLGGDFNTLGRQREDAVRTLHARFPSGSLAPPHEATHVTGVGRFVRHDQLDYLFFRLPNEAVAPPYARLTRSPDDSEESFFGSDHSPLLGYVPVRDLASHCE